MEQQTQSRGTGTQATEPRNPEVQQRLLSRLRRRARQKKANPQNIRPILATGTPFNDAANLGTAIAADSLGHAQADVQESQDEAQVNSPSQAFAGQDATQTSAQPANSVSSKQRPQQYNQAALKRARNGEVANKAAQPRTTTKDPSIGQRLVDKVGGKLGDEITQQEKASQPTTRLGKVAEQRALKRGLGQARARGVASGAEALLRGEGVRGAADAAAVGALAAKKFQQFKNILLVAKVGSGITVVGIVITILIWGVQLVMGHILKRERWKMGKVELWIAASIWSLVLVLVALQLFGYAYLLWILSNPLGVLFENVFGS
ncbi:MAG: hypothetical protein H6760_04210 [Candidatus Nomurabacteria bacterium]|nr:MAG: hypothetical protein H6760_04210 [Candidatus Nomurabacteria bacterium]